MIVQAERAGGSARGAFRSDGRSRDRFLNVVLRYEPEGVWTAVSEIDGVRIVGLHIEAESETEARDEVLRWAPELLRDNHPEIDGTRVRFLFQTV